MSKKKMLMRKFGSIPIFPLGISYYKLNSDVLDSIGTNNGTVTGTTTFQSGLINNSFYFNLSSYIVVPYSASFPFSNGTNDLPFSVTLSFKVPETNSGRTLFSFGNNSSTRGIELLFEASGLIFRLCSNGAVGNRIEQKYLHIFVVGQWYNVAITYNGNGSTSGMKLLLDKVNVGVANTAGTYVKLGNGYKITIGSLGGWVYNFKGNIDDVVLYDYELTQTEVEGDCDRRNLGIELI